MKEKTFNFKQYLKDRGIVEARLIANSDNIIKTYDNTAGMTKTKFIRRKEDVGSFTALEILAISRHLEINPEDLFNKILNQIQHGNT